MRKLTFVLLAGAMAWPAAAAAQGHRGPPAGVTHGGGGHHVTVRHHGTRFNHPGTRFRHHRFNRGFFIHPFWMGPQFQVRNWQLYGFAAPPRDHRWVRFYDDAYLVDHEGRVQDMRRGLDWDEYGERWELEDGIPAYHGSNDFHPGERDYEWVESHGGPEMHAGHPMGPGYEMAPGYPMHPGCQPVAPCGGHGYGYGWGYAYPAIIIETTVTTGGGSYVTETVEEVVDLRQRQRRRARPAPPPRRPSPPPGERG